MYQVSVSPVLTITVSQRLDVSSYFNGKGRQECEHDLRLGQLDIGFIANKTNLN